MTTSILFLLLLASVSGALFQRRRISTYMGSLAFAWLILAGSGILATPLLSWLQSNPRQGQPIFGGKNLIIILGGGVHKWSQEEFYQTNAWASSRMVEALRLYHLCKKAGVTCHLLASGGDPRRSGTSESHVLKRQLAESGVPSTDILTEDKSSTTFQNARYSAPIVAQGNYQSVIIVTSGFHLKRSLMIFEKFGMRVSGAPSEDISTGISPIPSSANMTFTDLAVHELLGWLKYELYFTMGWDA